MMRVVETKSRSGRKDLLADILHRVREEGEHLVLLPIQPLTLGVHPPDQANLSCHGLSLKQDSPSTFAALNHCLFIVIVFIAAFTDGAVAASESGTAALSTERLLVRAVHHAPAPTTHALYA